MKYEIRQIEAWNYGDEGWVWNNSWNVGEFRTNAKHKRRAFADALRRIGYVWNRNSRVYRDGDIYELRNVKTGEPLMAAIPLN